MHDERIQNEIRHGRFLKQHDAGDIWNWGTPAGKIRLQRRVVMLSGHITPDMKVLELGCGTGLFTKEFAKTGARVTAIDVSPDLLLAAQEDIRAGNVDFEVADACRTDFENETFDAVIGSSVLHHLAAETALAEIFRVLKPGGTVRFTEPNMLNPQIFLQKNIPSLKKKLGDSPDETAFVRWKLKNRLEHCGFKNVRVIPFDFLHPRVPPQLIPLVKGLGGCLEHIPVLKEIAGSLSISAVKPKGL